MGAPGAAIGAVGRRKSRTKRELVEGFLEDIQAAQNKVADLKMAEHSPEELRTVLDKMVGNPSEGTEGDTTTVFISADELLKLRQDGVLVGEEVVDVNGEPIEPIEERGGDIEVKIADLLALPE